MPISLNASITKQGQRSRSSSTALSAAVVKRTSRTRSPLALPLVGRIAKQTPRSRALAQPLSAAVVRQARRSRTSSVSWSVSLSRLRAKTVVLITKVRFGTGPLQKQINVSFAMGAVVLKRASRSYRATTPLVAAASRQKRTTKLAATPLVARPLQKQFQRSRLATTPLVASITRAASNKAKIISVSTALVASAGRARLRSILAGGYQTMFPPAFRSIGWNASLTAKRTYLGTSSFGMVARRSSRVSRTLSVSSSLAAALLKTVGTRTRQVATSFALVAQQPTRLPRLVKARALPLQALVRRQTQRERLNDFTLEADVFGAKHIVLGGASFVLSASQSKTLSRAKALLLQLPLVARAGKQQAVDIPTVFLPLIARGGPQTKFKTAVALVALNAAAGKQTRRSLTAPLPLSADITKLLARRTQQVATSFALVASRASRPAKALLLPLPLVVARRTRVSRTVAAALGLAASVRRARPVIAQAAAGLVATIVALFRELKQKPDTWHTGRSGQGGSRGRSTAEGSDGRTSAERTEREDLDA